MGSYVIILIAVFGLMWLLLIRPQRKRQLQQSRMQDAIEPGDDVLTAGGIHGVVRKIEGEIVHVEIAPDTTVRLDRRARGRRRAGTGARDRNRARTGSRARAGEGRLGRRKLICPDSSRGHSSLTSDSRRPDPGRPGRGGAARDARLARAQEGHARPRPAGRPRGRAQGGAADGQDVRRGLHGPLDLDHAQPHRQARRLRARDPQAGLEPDRDPARRRPRRQQGGRRSSARPPSCSSTTSSTT